MLETWGAARVEFILGGGTTKPLVLNCLRTAENSPIPEHRRFVVKCLDLPRIGPLSLYGEVVGNLLARELGIDTPAPALIELGNTFTAVANVILAPDGLRLREGIGVGCEYFQGGFTGPVYGSPLAPEEVPQATLLYGFDLLVQNPDRRHDKTNCGFRGQRLIAFDFEMSFSFLRLVGQQAKPWEVSKHGIASKHLFQRRLSQREVNWKPLLAALDSFDLSLIQQWGNLLPDEWCSGADRVAEHLRAVKQDLARFEIELQRSLTCS